MHDVLGASYFAAILCLALYAGYSMHALRHPLGWWWSLCVATLGVVGIVIWLLGRRNALRAASTGRIQRPPLPGGG
jgi:hypothetical protein